MSNFIERPRYFCSLGGAMSTITALPRTIPILHAASGCAGSIAWAQNGGSALQVGGYCGGLAVPSSNVQEREVVFGGYDRLREQIENTLDVIDGDLYFVITGCVTEVIGDDIRAVVSEFKGEGVDILAAETGGFRGNSYYGYDIVMQALVKDFVTKGRSKVKGKVNVFGIVPYMDVFWRGNLEGIRLLLEKLGLTVNTFFTSEDSLEEIKNSSEAELNIVVSDIYGVETAQSFEEIHKTPYIVTALPIGPSASDDFLRKIGDMLSIDKQLVEKVIQHENDVYYSYVEPLVECYNDLDMQRYAAVVGDVNYARAVTKFLADDLGWIPEFVVFTDQLKDEQKEGLERVFDGLESGLKPRIIFDTDTSQVIKYINEKYPKIGTKKYFKTFTPGFIVGSSLDREAALSLGVPHLSISFPVANRAILDRSYTGYRGGLRLTEDILSAAIAAR